MHVEKDHTIRELGRSQLTLRKDLVFSPRTSGKESYYLVEDRANSRFFRLGIPEYTFVSLLDGQTSVSAALRLTSQAIPNHTLTEHDAAAICQWLVDSDLAQTQESSQANRLARKARETRKRERLNRYNPLVVKMPFGNPDGFFEVACRWLFWFYSKQATALWLLLVSAALWQVYSNWHLVVSSSAGILAPDNWVWLLACWLLLKIVHESSHGIVCKMHGGSVRETGVIFVLFAPLAYVDVTSSWRFKSKWSRIHTASAGMYAELFVAAAAVFLWRNTNPGCLNVVCFNLMVMASVTTLAFNANPLMKFDGYYIFADLLEIPNLYLNGQQYLYYWGRRYLLGLEVSLPSWLPKKGGVITRCYGVLALVWRVLVCLCLIVAATALFHGAGVVLAAVAVAVWWGVPLAKLIKYLIVGKAGERPNRIRCSVVGLAVVLIVAASCTIVPWPGGAQAPGIVEFAPYTIIRAGSPGFIEQVCVEGGQLVDQGQVLAVLRNDELAVQLADLELEIQKSEITGRSLQNQRKMAEYQAEMQNRQSLKAKLHEKQGQVDDLTIRAPREGRLIGRQLKNLEGTYVKQGAPIMGLGGDDLELRISIAQDDLEAFKSRLGGPVNVRLSNHSTLRAKLTEVTPRASVTPSHPALISPAGGPLAVRRDVLPESDVAPEQEYELLAPRFRGTVEIPRPEQGNLVAGQRATITYRPFHEAFGEHLYRQALRWVRERWHRLTRQAEAREGSSA